MTLEEVYREHFRFVWRSLRRLGIHERDAQDATQEVFLVVHRKLGEFEGRSQMTTWLFGICLRVVRNRKRKHSARFEVHDEGMAEQPSGTVTFLLTDVEGSTALWERAPDAMRTALARHDALFEAVVAEHRGVHIRPRGEGDSRFAVFGSAPGAVVAALAVAERGVEVDLFYHPACRLLHGDEDLPA